MAAQEDGGWNQVSRKQRGGRGGRLRHIPTITAATPTQTKTGDKLKDESNPSIPGLGIIPNPSPEFSVADIKKHHDAFLKDWLASSCWKTLQATLAAALSTSESNGSGSGSGSRRPPIIKKAICLGPGPYDPSNGSFAARRTAHMQTACFRSIVQTIEGFQSQSQQGGHGEKIKCIIQEPAFTTTDEGFCRSHLGFEVARSPDAFGMVDADTLLFGIHMELQTYHLALTDTEPGHGGLALTLPAVYVGAGLSEWETMMDFDPSVKELLGPFAEMDASYEKRPFPDLNYMFSSTVMYWRKGGKGEEVKKVSEAAASDAATADEDINTLSEKVRGLTTDDKEEDNKDRHEKGLDSSDDTSNGKGDPSEEKAKRES